MEQWFSNLFNGIGSWFSNLFTFLGDFFSDVGTWFYELPGKVGASIQNVLLYLFVPQNSYFTGKVEEFKIALNNKTHYQVYLDKFKEIESISDLTGDTDNITTHIDLSNYSITDRLTINMSHFIDFSIFSQYKDTWYSWIRVILYICLVIYNINQAIKMFNGFGAVEGSVSSSINNLRGDKK